MSPDSWKGSVYQYLSTTNPPISNWVYEVHGAEGSLGTLRHTNPIYLEAGSYGTGMFAPPTRFPKETAYWRNVVEFELAHQVTGAKVISKFNGKLSVTKGRVVVALSGSFSITETAQGYYEVSLKFLERPPNETLRENVIDDLFLRRT